MESLSSYFLSSDPVESFQKWFEAAAKKDSSTDAFTLATASPEGVPSARVLLLKGYGPGAQYRFYTHSNSQKGHELEQNPRACMVFYWVKSEKQVRINGVVKKLSRKQTAEYFHSRAHESQVASFVSDQSQKIQSREELEQKFHSALEKFKGARVPLPENWQGYELEAHSFEFFVYGKHRLNDRFLYTKKSDGAWGVSRLQP